ncbi:T9SS type A sorting domain-containing protein [candidate division KSB1 bacterium]|nr:T9SS type A sorting domain-containing protein [candidate division KSB1 bacterium]NIR70112.1 T9SS type A sorting domain-containing protein [candidate division KSB1 bacterium]NIS27537.1 T9SS type A sorting domain-containing protein [candidate division KSB1 bacterium]NIT74388.1 T9SS type A sorting domain-containing protein [candidate division KSB1 bacterium]NIU28255.1 T9SS type A sorting domain-containing protein [candidate division KSB1 bacterium]
MSENYPNPFNPTTTLRFTVANKAQRVILIIYDILGRVVRVLADEILSAGEHRVQWDGKNQKGIQVANGTYVYKLKAENFVDARKMILLK